MTADQLTADVPRGRGASAAAGGGGVSPDAAATSPEVSRMVRLIRESFALVAPHSEDVARHFYGLLFSYAPATRELFPANMQVQRSRLLRALVHVVQMVDRPADLGPFLGQLGRDHRKFGVLARHYEAVGRALVGAVREFSGKAWTPGVEQAWTDAYAIISTAMQESAEAEQGPASWSARVVEHRRLSWDLAVVQVLPSEPIPYAAGQYVSVETPQRPRLWRYLSPANAPREDGSMEFHVRAVEGGWVSRAIVAHAQVGDTWRIGSAMGRMTVDRGSERDVVMVAGGTGAAPVHAMCEQLASWADNPVTRVFVGGRTPEDLYAVDRFRWLAAGNPWLTVTPVVEKDPLVMGARHGTLADVVTSEGSWPDHDVMVCGSPGMIRATVSQMLVAGTPLDRIRYDPFTVD